MESGWQYIGLIIPLAGISIPIIAIVTEHRRKARAIEVLKVYAERGEEPPASVIELLNLQSGDMFQRRQVQLEAPTGPEALPRFAFFLCLALGFAAATWFFYRGGPRENWLFVTGFGIAGFAMLAQSMASLARAFIPARPDGQ